CAWLPGDVRGFRSDHHRIHSSGDYRNPPSPFEHEGLRRYHQQRHSEPVKIPRDQRTIVARAIAESLISLGFIVWVVSVSATHAHIVAELPQDLREYNRVLGKAKSDSSRAVKKALPGQVWARKDKHKLLRDERYRQN